MSTERIIAPRHRDLGAASLCAVCCRWPGAVNWMVAGSGIAHCERSAPAFLHHPAESLPRWESEGARLTLVLGSPHRGIPPFDYRLGSPHGHITKTRGRAAEAARPLSRTET